MSALPLVVITRPQEQSLSFAQSVQSMGREPIFFPAFTIQALDDYQHLDATLHNLHQYQLLMFVSPNAVAMVLQRMRDLEIAFPHHISVAVVGEASKASLREFGINEQNTHIISPKNLLKTDSETLLEELPLEKLKDHSVLIFRGETGREFLSERLLAHGINVARVCAYRRIVPDFDAQKKDTLQTLLKAKQDWIVTSSSTLSTLLLWATQLNEVDFKSDLKSDLKPDLKPDLNSDSKLSSKIDTVKKMQQQRLYVPHIRIAQVAQELGFESVIMTSSGDEKLLLALQSSTSFPFHC